MSYSNQLYLLNAADLTLYGAFQIGPMVEVDFFKTGNALCEAGRNVYFTVNASEDGRYLAIGSAESFVLFDMSEEKLIPTKQCLPKDFGIGSGTPHTRTFSR